MSFGADNSGSGSAFKTFESEGDIEEKRRKRQEEWEKVRKPEDPQDAPEEKYDPRCLFDRLEEQKQKKQDDVDDQHRLSNLVKGLDDDEAEFLDFVSQKTEELKQKREQEESAVLAEYRDSVVNQVTDKTKPTDVRKTARLSQPGTQCSKKTQLALLAGAVKRKNQDAKSDDADIKKSKAEESCMERLSAESTEQGGDPEEAVAGIDQPCRDHRKPSVTQPVNHSQLTTASQTAQVIGILPGLGAYGGSETEDSSSDSDIELPVDIFKCRKIIMQHTQGQ